MSAALQEMRARYRQAHANLNRRPDRLLAVAVVVYPTPIGPQRPIRDVMYVASSKLPKPIGTTKPSYEIACEIMAEVCAARDVTPLEIAGPWRFHKLTAARQEVCYRLRKETTWSFPQIGHYLGKRDHTTILHGYRAHAKRAGLPL